MGWHVRVEGKGARGMAQVVVNCSNGHCRCSGSSVQEQRVTIPSRAFVRVRSNEKFLPSDSVPLHI